MFELLGEAVSFTLETLSLALVHCGLAHAGALTVRVSVVHLKMCFKVLTIQIIDYKFKSSWAHHMYAYQTLSKYTPPLPL